MKCIDLSGAWSYETDETDIGISGGFYCRGLKNDGFILPGSTCENQIGKKTEYSGELTNEAVRAPRERYEYVGPLWLRRVIDVPEDAEGKCVRLFLERVNIASELWIDGKKAGRRIIELSAPHVYDLTGIITPGRHTITLRIDNRNILNIADMASGYSVDTQGYWNGIIGRMELQYEEIFHIENIQVYPNARGARVRLTAASGVSKPDERRKAEFFLSVTAPDGVRSGEKHFERVLFNSRQPETFELDIDDIKPWDEFEPNLYTLSVRAVSKDSSDEKSVRFGMREIKTEGRKIMLNGRQISLRGTIDCAQYPLTGYPPTDISLWRENFRVIREYGLNHVRFHAWCPPECAFDAADEAGMYISVEMPLWLNKDVTPLEYGSDPVHDLYYPREARVISKAYGNHPSFIMFSNGNETMGNFELLSDITAQMRAYDTRRLYTVTSNFDHPLLECEDYLCAFEANGNRIRIQNLHDDVARSTCLDYAKAVSETNAPVISFEMGQYCSYPDVDICEKYTGNMLPVNFDAIRRHMIARGLYPRLKEYVAASGAMAVRLYKEDIEAALRTKDFGGFELLSLIDYTGQSTATVGILDVFFESKGLISPEEFRRFCGDTVPLFKARRIFKNTETLEAELDLYDFGKAKTENPEFRLMIYNGGELFYDKTTSEKRVSVRLDKIKEAAMLKVVLSVGKHENSWRIYVYPEPEKVSVPKIISSREELSAAAQTGGAAIVTAHVLENPVKGSFVPVFWSPVHFPTNRPSGEIIDYKHPVFSGFPTEKYPDYQWKTLLDNSLGADISGLKGLKPIVEVVPNFVFCTPVSPLFEARLGKARLLFCGFDLTGGDLPSAHLRKCIFEYVNSDKFNPEYVIENADDIF